MIRYRTSLWVLFIDAILYRAMYILQNLEPTLKIANKTIKFAFLIFQASEVEPISDMFNHLQYTHVYERNW